VASGSIQPFGHNRHEPKIGGCAPLQEGELGPYLTQCGQGRGYLHAKFHLDPCSRLATIDMDRKLGALPPFWGGELGPHLTQCLPSYQVAS